MICSDLKYSDRVALSGAPVFGVDTMFVDQKRQLCENAKNMGLRKTCQLLLCDNLPLADPIGAAIARYARHRGERVDGSWVVLRYGTVNRYVKKVQEVEAQNKADTLQQIGLVYSSNPPPREFQGDDDFLSMQSGAIVKTITGACTGYMVGVRQTLFDPLAGSGGGETTGVQYSAMCLYGELDGIMYPFNSPDFPNGLLRFPNLRTDTRRILHAHVHYSCGMPTLAPTVVAQTGSFSTVMATGYSMVMADLNAISYPEIPLHKMSDSYLAPFGFSKVPDREYFLSSSSYPFSPSAIDAVYTITQAAIGGIAPTLTAVATPSFTGPTMNILMLQSTGNDFLTHDRYESEIDFDITMPFTCSFTPASPGPSIMLGQLTVTLTTYVHCIDPAGVVGDIVKTTSQGYPVVAVNAVAGTQNFSSVYDFSMRLLSTGGVYKVLVQYTYTYNPATFTVSGTPIFTIMPNIYSSWSMKVKTKIPTPTLFPVIREIIPTQTTVILKASSVQAVFATTADRLIVDAQRENPRAIAAFVKLEEGVVDYFSQSGIVNLNDVLAVPKDSVIVPLEPAGVVQTAVKRVKHTPTACGVFDTVADIASEVLPHLAQMLPMAIPAVAGLLGSKAKGPEKNADVEKILADLAARIARMEESGRPQPQVTTMRRDDYPPRREQYSPRRESFPREYTAIRNRTVEKAVRNLERGKPPLSVASALDGAVKQFRQRQRTGMTRKQQEERDKSNS